MTTDGFGTLTANIMERGTSRVRAVLGNNAAAAAQTAHWHHADVSSTAAKRLADVQDNRADAQDNRPDAPNDGDACDAPKQDKPPAISQKVGTGTNLMIQQSPEGRMSEVTVSLWGARLESQEPGVKTENGQIPTSVTYERCDLDEHLAKEAENEPPKQMWIDTPTFSGPDRRHVSVSPEVEKRKSVPPRLKVSVRLEQERYLRLKLAAQDTQRTQQDIITSAVDYYLDDLGVDRFVRIAMGFGGAPSTLKQVSLEDAKHRSEDC